MPQRKSSFKICEILDLANIFCPFTAHCAIAGPTILSLQGAGLVLGSRVVYSFARPLNVHASPPPVPRRRSPAKTRQEVSDERGFYPSRGGGKGMRRRRRREWWGRPPHSLLQNNRPLQMEAIVLGIAKGQTQRGHRRGSPYVVVVAVEIVQHLLYEPEHLDSLRIWSIIIINFLLRCGCRAAV